ncbi:MAG: hypothetical protein L6R37_005632 [Teloschistes peruensis]|nr:MAG: hypothetical protein L6R37_005632 [Teloschistes peruensis]
MLSLLLVERSRRPTAPGSGVDIIEIPEFDEEEDGDDMIMGPTVAKAVAGENIITISDSEDEDGDETAGPTTKAKGKAKERAVVSGEEYITIPDTDEEEEKVTIVTTTAAKGKGKRRRAVSSEDEDSPFGPGRKVHYGHDIQSHLYRGILLPLPWLAPPTRLQSFGRQPAAPLPYQPQRLDAIPTPTPESAEEGLRGEMCRYERRRGSSLVKTHRSVFFDISFARLYLALPVTRSSTYQSIEHRPTPSHTRPYRSIHCK